MGPITGGNVMDKLFSSFSGLQIFFLACAAIGGILFFVRLILQLFGSDHDMDSDLELDHGDAGHMDSDTSFRILTLNGLTSFFIMFGLAGLALYKQTALGTLFSIVGAAGVGVSTVWLLGKIIASAKKLQSSGTIEVVGAIGSEGTVYTTIPASGTGSVQIIVRDRLREFDAVSHNKEEIRTGERIKVVWVNGNILVVEKG
jgi:membrane protein implicated in regulation of membrane protease activity